MKPMLIIFFILFFLYITVQSVYTMHYFRIGSKLAQSSFSRKTTLGDKNNPVFRLFIAGDSVGAGVGADSFEASVAGQLGEYFSKDHYIEFENISVSGHKVEDLLDDKLPSENQDLIVLIVSSNNLFRFTSIEKFEKDSRKLLEKYTSLTNKLILIGPGRIADSPAVPLIIKPIYLTVGTKYASILEKNSKEFTNVVYVNPLNHKAEKNQYGETLAEDNFHPNDNGHKYWFDLIKTGF